MKLVNPIFNFARPTFRLPISRVAAWLLPFCLLQATAATVKIPAPEREFRAAWVATVANIDWPSRRGMPSDEQRQELVAILDRAVELNLNAIVFQVRPHCDAIYASELEPWSEYLSGAMGQPPQPYYDPLELAVSEAHRRGLELHAWFNPYRALHSGSQGAASAAHVSNTRPQMVRKYGKQLWLDPGEKAAADHTVAVILDVVHRYDVDGIHFDDYFYPYPINAPSQDGNEQLVPFPDDPSWQVAQAAGNTLNRDDWRRQNVDRLIERLTDKIHAAKPWVKFGISPFGIWRPGHPPQIAGFDAYASLYADSKKWWNEGWVDYLTPQLYWKIESPGQCYPVLMQWWHQQNLQGRHLWPGNFASRVASQANGNWPAAEIINQIKHTRAHPGAGGNVHFSMKALMDDDRGLAQALIAGVYSKPALIPSSPWLGGEAPKQPSLSILKLTGKSSVRFRLPDVSAPWLWVVRTCQDNRWTVEILPGHICEVAIETGAATPAPLQIAVSAVNRSGVEGPLAVQTVAASTGAGINREGLRSAGQPR